MYIERKSNDGLNIMKLERIRVKIKDGHIHLKSDSHKRLFKKWLSQYEGEEIYLSVEQIKSKRSNEQNAYLWLFYTIIAEETGHTKEEIHEWARSKFLTEEIVKVFGELTRRRRSTTSLSKGEFIEYLANISLETGIELPDTTEYWNVSYHK